MTFQPYSPPRPPARQRSFAAPLALLAMGVVGILASQDGTFFGMALGAPLRAWLTGELGPDGVPAALDVIKTILTFVAALGVLWLLTLYVKNRSDSARAPEAGGSEGGALRPR
ncbi:MAG TPA: hypothetical protein VOA87_19820 [Thermoanaerobaculia bacterium]|nr:hypothetical protein [Thermoanaerobaculia bacterium]